MNILKGMCINISVSIIEKVFHYEESKISVIRCKDNIWLRGKDIAKALGYSIPRKAIREHVDPENRSSLECLAKGSLKWTPLKNEQKSEIFINKSGLYSLILQSKLESAKAFKRWVTKDVLPSIRRTGRYAYCMNHKYSDMLTFKIESETDLHVKVVSFLKKRYPHSLFMAMLGQLQDTCEKRIDSWRKGYIHWKNIYKSYHENIMFFREKIMNCFLKIIIIMIFFSSYSSVSKKIIIIKIIFKKHILSFLD